MHRPGIEPGPPAWQASILPLNQRCFVPIYLKILFQILLSAVQCSANFKKICNFLYLFHCYKFFANNSDPVEHMGTVGTFPPRSFGRKCEPYLNQNVGRADFPKALSPHFILKCSAGPAIVQEVIKYMYLFFSNAIQVISAHLFRLVG